MATVLGKELKRRVTIDGVDYTIAIDPDGFRVTGLGKRRPEVELSWRDLVSGEAAMAVALNASLATAAPSASQRLARPDKSRTRKVR